MGRHMEKERNNFVIGKEVISVPVALITHDYKGILILMLANSKGFYLVD